MNRKGIICFIFLFLLATTHKVSAQTNMGLSWGVSVGDSISYNVEITSSSTDNPTTVISESILVSVLELADLSLYRDPSGFPTPARVNMTYVNGSSIENDDPLSLYSIPIIILPVGNWTLYREIVENTNPMQGTTYSYSEDSNFWELGMDYARFDSIQNVTYQFSKSDGALQAFTMHSQFNSTGLDSNTVVHIYRASFWEVSSIFVLSSIAIIAEIALVIVIIFKYRQRNSKLDILT